MRLAYKLRQCNRQSDNFEAWLALVKCAALGRG
jgi:hypothetical protein